MKKNLAAKSSRIARRLGLHFTIQFFMIWLSVLATAFIAIFALMYYIGNDQIQSDSPTEMLDSLSLETLIEADAAQIPSFWPEQLQKKGYWLQIVNNAGDTIYNANVPNDVPTRYSAAQLLRLADTGRMDEYRVSTLYEEFQGAQSLYILGQVDTHGERLQTWFNRYADQGNVIDLTDREQISDQANQLGLSLKILDGNGRIIQQLGVQTQTEGYDALELVKIRSMPGNTDTKFSYLYDAESDMTWILEWPNEEADAANQPIFRIALIVSIIVGGAILLLAFGLAAWHGYRYGGPLLLFMRGFERMGRGEYEKVFTEKESRKIFRKNGRFRSRYKLYREVITGFSDMAGKMEEARSERLRLERSREEWMTGISHDLRTPLAAVHGYGHLLESGQFHWSEDELRDMGATIREKSSYMLELLQDFSLTFELKNHTPGEKLEPLELNEFVRRAVLRYVNDATLSDVTFGFEENQAPIRIMANAKWFQRLLDNLISNAVKHNGPGTEILLCVSSEGTEAVVKVQDDGIGMNEETKARLFDRYYRGTSTDEGIDGVGLGMSIAYAVVTAHKGSILVDSSPGNGTLITLTFPAADFRSLDI